MEIFKFSSGLLGVNTYFLVNEKDRTAVIIDGGERYNFIKQKESELGVKIVAELLTHAHFDHSANAKALQDDGVKIYISQKDSYLLDREGSLASHFGKSYDTFTPDFIFNDGDILNINGIAITVLETPGHSNGSVTFMIEDNLFTGDTLFFESIGRTDFPGGDPVKMKQSLKKLTSLKGDFKVYPGHGEQTTLDYERKHNYYIIYDKD